MKGVGVCQGLLKMDWWAAKSQSCPCSPACMKLYSQVLPPSKQWVRGRQEGQFHFIQDRDGSGSLRSSSQGEWHKGGKQMKEHFRLCQEACHQLVMEDWPVGILSDYVCSFLIHPHPKSHAGRWLPVSDAPPPTIPHLPFLQLWLQLLFGALPIFIIPNTRKIMNTDK